MTQMTLSRQEFQDMFLPEFEALACMRERHRNADLRKAVSEFLQGDLPDYLSGPDPVLYLARHLATPNAETLYFLQSLAHAGERLVIGQDPRDKFVSVNAMKRALGRLPILDGPLLRHGPRPHLLRRWSIVDFQIFDGHPIHQVLTLWGEPLVAFHERLFAHFSAIPCERVMDSAWIDRNGRGDLRLHYERMLALFICHGVLFEDYWIDDPLDTSERWFVSEVLRPAYLATAARFGVPPLMVHLDLSFASDLNLCFGYSEAVGSFVKDQLTKSLPYRPILDSTCATRKTLA